MTLGWGIIGIGSHANRYLAPAIRAAAGCELVAVWSRDQGRAEAFAQRHGARRAYGELAAFLKDEGVEAVLVASPNALHAEHTIAAAQAGKHVLTEKAMTTTVADARRMVAACQQAGVRLGVGYHLRHHPAHQELRRLVQQRAVGDLVWARGQYMTATPALRPASPARPDPSSSGGGILIGIGVHIIDLLRYLTGQEVVAVSALCAGRPTEHRAALLLRFGSGLTAVVESGRGVACPTNEVVLYGDEGTLLSHGSVVGGHSGLFIEAEVRCRNLWGERAWRFSADRVYINEIEDFAAAVREGRDPLATGSDGLRDVEVCVAAYRSADEGRLVQLREVQEEG